MEIEGRVLKYDDADINTDVIWPGKYTYIDVAPEEMSQYAFENYDSDFEEKVDEYDILAVGPNFGCGSSREQAASCLKHSGIEAVISPMFARIFYRNAINLGLPAVESRDLFEAVSQGDRVEINLSEGNARTGQQTFSFSKYPDRLLEILREGNVLKYWYRKK